MVLYTTDCPKCNIIKKQLDDLSINYSLQKDIDIIQEKGFLSVPMLELDNGKILNFNESIEWLTLEGENK